MSTEPPPRPRTILDLFGSPRGGVERAVFVVYWICLLAMTAVVVSDGFDRDMGPGQLAYALLVTTWTFCLTPAVAIPAVRLVTRFLPRHCFRVPAGERALHRVLGVGVFGGLLERSGYNRRFAEPLRGFDGTRAGLPSLEQSVLGGAIAHGTVFALHLLLAAAALFTGHPWGALWIILPGVVVHLYPVLLQRSIMLRLQPLLDRRPTP